MRYFEIIGPCNWPEIETAAVPARAEIGMAPTLPTDRLLLRR
jgi:hypothetical protein